MKICVYCGSNKNIDEKYLNKSYEIGKLLALSNYEIIYGGAAHGMMGNLAKGALDNRGKVIGIYPEDIKFDNERLYDGLSQVIITKDMHSRKAAMSSMADAFLILPGGIGTMDEFFEILTWRWLNIHHKPIIIYNFAGFYEPLLKLFDHFIESGFAIEEMSGFYQIIKNDQQLISILNNNK